jgi:F-type H+-transporting ATPase subunit b
MQIDWLTVGAQIVNFLVLVWLLQHFLYGPIIRAMDRREQRIADRLREAEAKHEAAEEEARAYRDKQAALERQRKELLEEARDAAAEERRSLEQQARDEVAERKHGWLEQLAAERRSFTDDLRRRSADAFYAVARRALGELADAELETQIVHTFIRQLGKLDDETLEKLKAGAGADDGHVVVESRFALDSNLKRQLTRTIHDRLGSDLPVDYRETEGLDVGITLAAGSQHVAWSIGHFLDDLERAVDDELARETAALEREHAPGDDGKRSAEAEAAAKKDAEATNKDATKEDAAR